jgi:hypothetical protein
MGWEDACRRASLECRLGRLHDYLAEDGGFCITPRKGSIQIQAADAASRWGAHSRQSLNDDVQAEEVRLFLEFVTPMEIDVLPGNR